MFVCERERERESKRQREREKSTIRVREGGGGREGERGAWGGPRGRKGGRNSCRYFKDVVYIVYTLPSFFCFRLPWRP